MHGSIFQELNAIGVYMHYYAAGCRAQPKKESAEIIKCVYIHLYTSVELIKRVCIHVCAHIYVYAHTHIHMYYPVTAGVWAAPCCMETQGSPG